MPNEAIISRIEILLDEVVSLGGASERTGIVSGLIVVDSAPSSAALANHIIVRDSRDGNFISVLKTPGQTYANNDLVSVLFIEGTEPIALAQSPGSSSGNVKVSEVWESDFGAVTGSADASGNWTWQGNVTLASGNLNFSQASIIAVTGALQINATGGVVVNESGLDADFRIEGDNDQNLIFVDAGNDRVGFGTNTPNTFVEFVKLAQSSTSEVIAQFRVSDAANDYLQMFNATTTDARFSPTFRGHVESNAFTVPLFFLAEMTAGIDTGTIPAMIIDSRRTSAALSTRPILDVRSFGNSKLLVAASGDIGIEATSPLGKMHVDQASTTGAKPVLYLDQADLSEEFIEFAATVGAGNPIDTAAIGTYYGKIRVAVAGVGFKYMALYNS